MSALANLTREEQLGLGVAVVAHVALVAALTLQPAKRAETIPIPERMTVSLADEVSLESTAPDPSAEPAAAIAPVLAPEPAPVAEPQREVVRRPDPVPPPRTTPRSNPQPRPRPTQAAAPRQGGGSRIGSDFLPGQAADGNRSNDRGSPADAFGPAEAASLNSAISRQIKPHWSAPQGADADQLVTLVRFRLNADGSLSGSPSCVSTTGVTASNAAQKDLHCERAIRAVRLAAPFNLPEQFYDKWKLITSRFDRRL